MDFTQCVTQGARSFMRNDITFCIKTIHRPQCCAALVRSIYEYCGDDRPLIHVLDDGKPELRFSTCCHAEAAMVDRLIETKFDIGLSAGRNRLLDAGDSPVGVFTDDDHLVTEETRLLVLAAKLNKHADVDLLAALSNDVEKPKLMRVDGKTLRIPHGDYQRRDSIRRCHYVCNCFVSYRDILQAIRWDEALKVEEHWDFFWRAKIAGMKVACDLEHSFRHEHVDPPGYKRRRPECWQAGLRKHGLDKVVWK